MENIDNYILDEETLAEHYKESGNTYGYEAKSKLVEYLKELKAYKEAEEQGLLLKLPCKVGDTLYINNFRCCWQDEYEIPYEVGVLNIGMNEIHTYMEVLLDDGMIYHFNFSDIGKTIFLTKAEAEEALSKMGGN